MAERQAERLKGTALTGRPPHSQIRLYTFPLSGHSHRASLLLSLLDVPYEAVNVDVLNGENRRSEFLARNPLGQIPVLEDGDVVICDSLSILVYLALTYDADRTWLPSDPHGAAEVQRWLGVAAGPISFGPVRARRIVSFGDEMNLAEARATSERLFANLEREFADKAFAAGATPTIADVAAYGYIATASEGDLSLEPYPNIRAWLSRVEALPRFVPMSRCA